MANIQFNISAGKTVEYAARVNANDPANSALIVVALQASGLEADSVLVDYDNLSVLLAASNNEATNVGYARLVYDNTGGITVTVDDTNNWVDVDFPDPSWAAVATAGGAWGALLFCYDSDTTGGTDANIIPLTKHDFARTPNGGTITAVVPSGGWFREPSNPTGTF